MRKFGIYVALAVAAMIPGLLLRLTGTHFAPVLDTLIFGGALLAAGFMLSWSAETAEGHDICRAGQHETGGQQRAAEDESVEQQAQNVYL